MGCVGWALFILTLIWALKSLSFSHRKRLSLNHYMAYLLLNDGIRQKHQADFVQWLKNADATDAPSLAVRAYLAIEGMADSLAQGDANSPGSALGAAGLMWNVKKQDRQRSGDSGLR